MVSDRATGDCVAALHQLRRSWPLRAEMLVIEVQPGELPSTWDLVAYPMTRDRMQVDHLAVTVIKGVFLHDSHANEVAQLVGQWWQLTGGDRLPLPTYVAPHGYWQSFDVRRQRWIEDSELYAAEG